MKYKNHLRLIYFDTVKKVDYCGIFLLGFGLIVLGFSIYKNLQTTRSIAKLNVEINQIQDQAISKQSKKVENNDPQRIEIIDEIERQVRYPWESFFSTLEVIHTKEISLMSIQPNMDKKEVLISAEAANVHQMLEYIRILGTQKNIDHVELLSQETIFDNEQEKLNFVMMVKLI